MKTFHLPDLGEGLADGEITKWHVGVGDTIQLDEPLVAIETAKAVVEVPSPYTGKIVKLYAAQGDIVPTGSALVDFEVQQKEESQTVAGEIKVGNEILQEKASFVSKTGQGVKALPAVRALAKKMNVDLATVTPTGEGGVISADDVKRASEALSEAGPLVPLRGARRMMASVMAQSHAEVVPVTVMDDADITSWIKEKDFTVRVILALVKASQAEPALNAWYDNQALGRRLLSKVHVGLAMDTPDGLFVPVIRDAQAKDSAQLKAEIESLKVEVGNRTIRPEQLHGASIVLSNFGRFTGRYANPIVVPPTVAILGVGAWREEVVPYNGVPAIRARLPLSLTFDHRAVTGGEATRFLGVVIEQLK
jgi:2-oxoisovalerate dehydrogenase E2 component (dihydrolipoyl transacylase)